MRLRFRVRSLVIGVAAVALVAALISTAWRSTRNRIVVENRSGVSVESLSVTVGGKSIAFGSIPPGGTAEAAFLIRGDDHFAVTGKLADGSTLGGDFGYVTGGMYGETARFGIEPGGKIQFSQGG
jgi:hypothetical protein